MFLTSEPNHTQALSCNGDENASDPRRTALEDVFHIIQFKYEVAYMTKNEVIMKALMSNPPLKCVGNIFPILYI